MKKILFPLLALFAFVATSFAGSAASSFININVDTTISYPKNESSVQLGKCTSSSTDTIGATYSNHFGPFRLSQDPWHARYKGFRCLSAKGALPATCTTAVDYQIIGGTRWADTAVGKWVSFDSIKAAAGNSGTYVKLDTLPGLAIVFKLHCLANSSTAIVAKPVKIFFDETMSSFLNTSGGK